MKKAIISLSGGLDSTCLLMELLSKDYEVKSYSFDYGQKHRIELEKVQRNIKFLQDKGFKVSHQIINLRDVFSDSNSSLHEGGSAIPHDHYNAENQKSTVIENRNVIFSSIIFGKALSWANKTGDHVDITLGIHGGDHCFTENTKILTPDGYKCINELKIGDKIYSVDSSNHIIIDKVIDAFKVATVNNTLHIQTTTGSLDVTPEHKIYKIKFESFDSSKGYDKSIELVKANSLVPGDILLTSANIPIDDVKEKKDINIDLVKFGDMSLTKITNINEVSEEKDVFDITVEKNHNFFAGEYANILIHNCIYPDCRPESQEAAEYLYKISNWGSEKVDYIAPFVNIDKSEVLRHGVEAMKKLKFSIEDINTVLLNTHTCYDVNDKGESCGQCGSCRERLEAFEKNNMKDPVPYQK